MRKIGICARLDQIFDAPAAVREVLISQSGLDHSVSLLFLLVVHSKFLSKDNFIRNNDGQCFCFTYFGTLMLLLIQ